MDLDLITSTKIKITSDFPDWLLGIFLAKHLVQHFFGILRDLRKARGA